MSYKIKISNSAFDDLAFIKNFIALDNEHKANEYIKKLFEKIDCLQDFPFLGKKGDENKQSTTENKIQTDGTIKLTNQKNLEVFFNPP